MSERLTEILSEYLDEDQVDVSLFTGLDWQNIRLYGKLRQDLSAKYPKPENLREDQEDTIDIPLARHDPDASLFTQALTLVHDTYERTKILQHLATEHEKKIIRLYTHFTRNWSDFSTEYMKGLRDTDLYELVESYFKILRKHGLSTTEEPYYFLSPQQQRKAKVAGEMLKRATQIDDSEIRFSLLEEILSTNS